MTHSEILVRVKSHLDPKVPFFIILGWVMQYIISYQSFKGNSIKELPIQIAAIKMRNGHLPIPHYIKCYFSLLLALEPLFHLVFENNLHFMDDLLSKIVIYSGHYHNA